MRNILFPLLISVFLFNTSLFAQDQEKNNKKANKEKIKYLQNEKMRITSGRIIFSFDIINYKDVDLFYPSIDIFDEDGQPVYPENLSGDLDKAIKGGSNKRITWFYAKDGFTDAEAEKITFKIEVEKLLTKSFMIKRHLLLSTAFPGWGDYKIRDQKYAFWLYGLAGYCTAAASILYNNKAYNAYEDYKVSETIAESDRNFSNAKKYRTMSYIFAGTAIAIWTVDLTAGILKINKKTASYAMGNKPHFSVAYAYDATFNQPVLTLRLKL